MSLTGPAATFQVPAWDRRLVTTNEMMVHFANGVVGLPDRYASPNNVNQAQKIIAWDDS